MKDLLNDPLYLSVTATPQALIFLDEYSRLRPDSIRLIEPGQGYCGVDAYHLYDSGTIELINDEDQQDLSNGVLADSLKNAIRHYINCKCIMFIRGRKSSEMIIHSHRNVSAHSTIYRMVDAFIQSFKAQVEYTDTEGLETTKSEYKLAYSIFFDAKVQCTYDFDSLWDIICNKVIRRVYLILKNPLVRSHRPAKVCVNTRYI